MDKPTVERVVAGEGGPRAGERGQADGPPLSILHAISGLDPNQGGPATMLISLSAAQALLGHDVTVLTYRDGDNAERLKKAGGMVPGFDRVRIEYLPAMTRAESILGRRAAGWAKANIGRFAVAHTHGIWEAMIARVARAARARGVPYIITPHGMLDVWALRRKAFKKRLALWLGVGSAVRGSSAVHVLSTHERDCIVRGGFHRQPVIIPNGVFLEQVDPLPARGTYRATRPELGEDPFIFFLARLHPGKGLDLLAEAFARVVEHVPGARLVIAGPDFGAEAALKEQIRRLGIGQRTHLVGPIWDRMKFAALVDSACFCLPSEHEGFSMSIAEALACGTPVVITRLCHFPEVAEAGAGEVIERNADALTEALLRVLKHPEARGAYGAAGRRLIEERFTWPRIAQRTVDLYRTLRLSSRGAGA